MESIARRGIINGVAPILILLLLGSPAAAQDPTPKNSVLENIALCNGIDRTSPEPQIDGCTAVIDSGEHTPAAAIAYNNRGDAYTAKADYDRAVQDFDQSIKLNPTNAKPFNNSGVAYLKKGEYDLAIKNLDEAIRLNPNYAKAFVNRAETYQKKNEYDRAARDYDEAIRLDPNLKAAWTDAVGPAPSLVSCRRRWRTAIRRFSRSLPMPRRMTRVD
jgi:Lipoprotein NlpI, contains TPR repeats